MKLIPYIKLPIIRNAEISNENISDIMLNKKVIIFGVPGAFTPTCSEKHLPGFLNLNSKLRSKGIEDIYCISVNDAFVLKAWLSSYSNSNQNVITGIADGNAEFAKELNLLVDCSVNFMGYRCKRFSLISVNNIIINLNIDEKGQFSKSSAEYILNQL